MDTGATGAVASGKKNTGQEATTDWEAENPEPQGWSRMKQGPPATASKGEWGTLDDGGLEFFASPKLSVFRSKAKDNAEMVSFGKVSLKVLVLADGKTRIVGHGLENKRVVLNGFVFEKSNPALNKTDPKGVHVSFFNQATWDKDGSFWRPYIFKFSNENEAAKFCCIVNLAALANKALSPTNEKGIESPSKESPSKQSEGVESVGTEENDSDEDSSDAFPATQDCTAGGQDLAAALMAAYELEDKDKK